MYVTTRKKDFEVLPFFRMNEFCSFVRTNRSETRMQMDYRNRYVRTYHEMKKRRRRRRQWVKEFVAKNVPSVTKGKVGKLGIKGRAARGQRWTGGYPIRVKELRFTGVTGKFHSPHG